VYAACFDERWRREGMQYAGQTPAMPTPDALIFASYRRLDPRRDDGAPIAPARHPSMLEA